MKALITKGWNLMRILRLATGIAAIVYALITRETIAGIAGIFLVVMGLFNAGCSTGTCSIPRHRRSRGKRRHQ
ncbi:hypothetical protein [Flavihumibacter petaseus]|uniref:hypothetical protein n=1 Tax=Flavihumibacter petaseus TaxID=549295 RepID=UPI00061CEF58|nr:hypothetical protein [Flavihumibacter petaseus]